MAIIKLPSVKHSQLVEETLQKGCVMSTAAGTHIKPCTVYLRPTLLLPSGPVLPTPGIQLLLSSPQPHHKQ